MMAPHLLRSSLVGLTVFAAAIEAFAQVAPPPLPQPAPSAAGNAPAWPPTSSPVPQPSAPPGDVGALRGSPSGAIAAGHASSAEQPVDAPPPGSLLIPAPPVYPAPWLPPVSPHLGLVPGEGDPRWEIGVDALWLARCNGRGEPLGFSEYNYESHAPQQVHTHRLWSDDVYFPLAPGLRLQLIGRVTDKMAIEANAWGLQQWSVGRTIYGDPEEGSVLAYSPWLQTSEMIGGFDDSLGYRYDSQVANVELNQRFKLFSDDPYRSFSWLWGVRYLYLADDFALAGSDLYTGSFERLDWHTKNNLIGAQLGVQWAWGWDRFQLTTELKGGLYANPHSQNAEDLGYGPVDFRPYTLAHSSTDLAAVFEFSLALRCRLTKCAWLRAGYQYYGVTGLALGPRQLGGYDSSGTVGLDGLSLGLEIIR